jgi:hypothetical protein
LDKGIPKGIQAEARGEGIEQKTSGAVQGEEEGRRLYHLKNREKIRERQRKYHLRKKKSGNSTSLPK